MHILLILNVIFLAFSSFMVGKLSEVEGNELAIIINLVAMALNMVAVISHLN